MADYSCRMCNSGICYGRIGIHAIPSVASVEKNLMLVPGDGRSGTSTERRKVTKAKRTVAGLLAVAIAALCIGGPLAVSRGVENNSPGAAAKAAGEQLQPGPYLGLAVEPLSPALVSHLLKTFAHGQGIQVAGVADDSPAAKGGMKVYDVLMSYGDQKLFSPRQLLGLVRQDKAGHEVASSIVREGKPLTVRVTLAMHEVAHVGAATGIPEPELWELPPGWLSPRWQLPRGPRASGSPCVEGSGRGKFRFDDHQTR